MPSSFFSLPPCLLSSRCSRSRERKKRRVRKLVRMAMGIGGKGWILIFLVVALSGFLAAFSIDGGVDRRAAPLRRDFGHPERMMLRMDGFKAQLGDAASPSPARPIPSLRPPASRMYHVTDYGADPTGFVDSTDAILRAIADVFNVSSDRRLMNGIADLGGAEIHLDGGEYLISSPLTMPASGGGNFKIHSGSLRASEDFPRNRYMIELWAAPEAAGEKEGGAARSKGSNERSMKISSGSKYTYEYTTLRDLMLDCNFRGGGVAVVDALRTTIDNCYVAHFTTDGVWVQDGHETYIHNCYLGQHITAGSDPLERNFSGNGIRLEGNDNAVTDVVVFSAAIGILVAGQANAISGVHLYNKATAFGGTGIYVKSPGLTQTRILNCYLDYTSIVAEDPVQLVVSSSFFLGDANVVLKSVNGRAKGVSIVDNMFSGTDKGVQIVALDESGAAFTAIEQVFVDRNSVNGMSARSTVARATVEGNGSTSTWVVDFSPVLLFPDMVQHVQYTMRAGNAFPIHTLRNVSGNRVVIESDVPVAATVDVVVHQCVSSILTTDYLF